jgi:5-methylcytosine-specific restriction endonuclease McrBC regulatory subunit McrC
MVRRFVRWLFEDFITHLVRSHFYVTDTGAHRNRVFYFRKASALWKAKGAGWRRGSRSLS